MRDDKLYLLIGGALILALAGVVLLTGINRPVPDILPYVATSAIGALAMAARGNSSGDSAK
jgi:hypothetical protein